MKQKVILVRSHPKGIDFYHNYHLVILPKIANVMVTNIQIIQIEIINKIVSLIAFLYFF